MRTKEQVLEIIQDAFSPLRCVAEFCDYDDKVRFRVFGPQDQPILRFDDTLIDRLLDGPALSIIITSARHTVQKKGYRLDNLEIQD